jgi:hypothetical protein
MVIQNNKFQNFESRIKNDDELHFSLPFLIVFVSIKNLDELVSEFYESYFSKNLIYNKFTIKGTYFRP